MNFDHLSNEDKRMIELFNQCRNGYKIDNSKVCIKNSNDSWTIKINNNKHNVNVYGVMNSMKFFALSHIIKKYIIDKHDVHWTIEDEYNEIYSIDKDIVSHELPLYAFKQLIRMNAYKFWKIIDNKYEDVTKLNISYTLFENDNWDPSNIKCIINNVCIHNIKSVNYDIVNLIIIYLLFEKYKLNIHNQHLINSIQLDDEYNMLKTYITTKKLKMISQQEFKILISEYFNSYWGSNNVYKIKNTDQEKYTDA